MLIRISEDCCFSHTSGFSVDKCCEPLLLTIVEIKFELLSWELVPKYLIILTFHGSDLILHEVGSHFMPNKFVSGHPLPGRVVRAVSTYGLFAA